MKKKLLAVLLCICTTTTLFGGCGSSNDEGNNIATTGNSNSTEESVGSETKTNTENQITVLHKVIYQYGTRYLGDIYEYDNKGNLITETPFDFGHIGVRSETVLDENFNKKVIYYNRDGEEINREDFSEEEMMDTDVATNYKYDEKGNLVWKLSVEGENTYEYDSNNNLIKETDDYLTTTYEYDTNNNLIKKVSDFETIVYEYDDNNLVVEEVYGMSESLYLKNRKEYDSKGNLIKDVSYAGEYVSASYTYEYDTNGNLLLIEENQYWSSNDDAFLTDGSVASKNRTEYTYDTNNNVIEEKKTESAIWLDEDIVFDTKYQYDTHGNLTTTQSFDTYSPNWKTVYPCYSYEYDDRGNIIVMNELDKNGRIEYVSEYTYDEENRLLVYEKKSYNSLSDTWYVEESTTYEYITIEIAE